MNSERNLIYLYLADTVSGVTSSVSLSIAWTHWNYTLNTCVGEDENCGCILYSTATFNTFTGGARFLCSFSTFVQIPIILWALFSLVFHAYRVCVPVTKRNIKRRVRTVTFSEDGLRRSKPDIRERRSPPCYTLFAIVATLIGFLLITQVWLITGGYLFTCREYRRAVAKQLMANGQLSELVYDRLSCGTMLDFLDYLQPDPDILPDRFRRNYKINTAYLLQVALVSSWASCSFWLTTALYNFSKAFYKEK